MSGVQAENFIVSSKINLSILDACLINSLGFCCCWFLGPIDILSWLNQVKIWLYAAGFSLESIVIFLLLRKKQRVFRKYQHDFLSHLSVLFHYSWDNVLVRSKFSPCSAIQHL